MNRRRTTLHRSTDATIEELVAAADALVDEVEEAFETGDQTQTAALLTALDEVIDSQMALLGIPDPDETDTSTRTATGQQATRSVATVTKPRRRLEDRPKTIRRDNLRRALPFTVTRQAGTTHADDGLNLEGLAAVFNSQVVIESWEGRFKEQLAPGSFKKTLRERTPVLQFDHGQHPLIGSLPIGTISRAWEDGEIGVRVEARMSDNWLFEPVRESIASGAVNGMSFRFNVLREAWVDENGKTLTEQQVFERLWLSDDEFDKPENELMVRTIKEVQVSELGPVVFPAYDNTEVGVRSLTIDLGKLKQPRERAKLAHAIFAAEQGSETAPESEVGQSAPPPTGHPEGTTEAAAPPANAEHPASSTPDEQRDARSILARIDGTLSRIHARSGK